MVSLKAKAIARADTKKPNTTRDQDSHGRGGGGAGRLPRPPQPRRLQIPLDHRDDVRVIDP